MNRIRIAGYGVAFGLLLAPAALAVHGTVGTWEITWKMDGGAVGSTERFCMTLADVGSNKPPMSLHGYCKPTNTAMPGTTFYSEVVCGGRVPGRGTVSITFTSPTHYQGQQTVSLKLGDRMMTNHIAFDAKWLSPNCSTEPRH